MNYLPFIAGSYGITLVLALVLGIGSAVRLSRAKQSLRAVELRRGARPGDAARGRA